MSTKKWNHDTKTWEVSKVVFPLRKVTELFPSSGFGYYRRVGLECGHELAVPANQVSAARTKVRCKLCPPMEKKTTTVVVDA